MSQVNVLSAPQVLDRHYLELRCQLLDLAAAFDRIDRSGDARQALGDPRMTLLQQAIAIVASNDGQRAERLQLLFSDPYVEEWNRDIKKQG